MGLPSKWLINAISSVLYILTIYISILLTAGHGGMQYRLELIKLKYLPLS